MLRRYLELFWPATATQVERKILQLVTHAYRNVPFYRGLMDRHGMTPNDVRCLEDYVQKFPRTEATEYRRTQQRLGPRHVLDQRVNPERLTESQSSGSSGAPVSIFRTRREKDADKARTAWHLTLAGLRPWHRLLAVVDPLNVVARDSVLQGLGVFRRYFGHSMMSPDEIIDLMTKHRIDAVYGQKSLIRLVAERFERSGQPAPRLKLLMPGGERIYETDRQTFHRVFRPERYAEIYGSTETGIIAIRTERCYRVDFRSVFFCLSQHEKQGDVDYGRMTVTSLELEAQPILMIDLGDIVAVRSYGQLLQLGATIESIEGRDNDYLVLGSGERLTGMAFLAVLDLPRFILQFRVVQERPGECRVLLRVTEESEENRQEVRRLLDPLLAGRIRYSVEFVEEIPIEKSGKARVVVSALS